MKVIFSHLNALVLRAAQLSSIFVTLDLLGINMLKTIIIAINLLLVFQVAMAEDLEKPWWANSGVSNHQLNCINNIPGFALNDLDSPVVHDSVAFYGYLEQYITTHTLPSYGANKGVDRTIHEIDFKNESPYLLEQFKLLFTKEAIESNDLQLPISCHKFICVIDKVFGKKNGLLQSYIIMKYGFNTSPYSNLQNRYFQSSRSPIRWKKADLLNILSAFTLLPEMFTKHLFKNKPLMRIDVDADNIANAVIKIFNKFDNYLDGEKQMTIYHEVAHGLCRNLDQSPLWSKAGNWRCNQQYLNDPLFSKLAYSTKTPEMCISGYSETNPSEDCAESVMAYRLKPEELKSIAPEKYQIIKDFIFGGLEYLPGSSCQHYSSKITFDNQIHPNYCAQELLISENDYSSSIVKSCLVKAKTSNAFNNYTQQHLSNYDLSDFADIGVPPFIQGDNRISFMSDVPINNEQLEARKALSETIDELHQKVIVLQTQNNLSTLIKTAHQLLQDKPVCQTRYIDQFYETAVNSDLRFEMFTKYDHTSFYFTHREKLEKIFQERCHQFYSSPIELAKLDQILTMLSQGAATIQLDRSINQLKKDYPQQTVKDICQENLFFKLKNYSFWDYGSALNSFSKIYNFEEELGIKSSYLSNSESQMILSLTKEKLNLSCQNYFIDNFGENSLSQKITEL